MPRPLISCIIPVHNGAAFLADGMVMLGNDCVLIGDGGQAFSLYSTCCLTAQSQALFGLGEHGLRRPAGAGTEAKAVLLTDMVMPGRTIAAARPAAVVFPQLGGRRWRQPSDRHRRHGRHAADDAAFLLRAGHAPRSPTRKEARLMSLVHSLNDPLPR